MPYELTSLFTAVASASASFVAILGGLIAGKLITISGDRETVVAKIKEIEQQHRFKKTECTDLQETYIMQTSLDFVLDNVEELLNRKSLEDVYQTDVPQDISKAELSPYWEKAAALFEEVLKAISTSKSNGGLNKDDLPRSFAEKYSQDYFAYSVGKKIIREIERQRQNDVFIGAIPAWENSLFVTDTLTAKMDEGRMDELREELKWLEFQLNQLYDEKKKLCKPKGIKAGIAIFALFSLCCIVLPLVLSPLSVNSLVTFWILKLLILMLLAAGLVSVFGYLIFLLKWGEKSKDEHN